MKEYPVTVPAEDHSGDLSPIVLDAMSKGATSRHCFGDPDVIEIVFAKKADADAFAKACKILFETMSEDGTPPELAHPFADGFDSAFE